MMEVCNFNPQSLDHVNLAVIFRLIGRLLLNTQQFRPVDFYNELFSASEFMLDTRMLIYSHDRLKERYKCILWEINFFSSSLD
jgi:hypothetical protein